MQHLRIRNVVAVAALCLLSVGFAAAQDQGPSVARVSFVQGSVQLMTGQGSDFEQAVMNMPVLDGSRLQTGGDGQVEVEFGDGSVARLTPNSAIQFDHLGQDQAQLQQLGGLVYYEFNVGDGHPPFSMQFSGVSLQPTANSILRVGLDAGWEVAVISGSARVQGAEVAENQTIRSSPDNSGAPYSVAQGVNGDSWDNWNQDRDQAIAQEASQQTPVRDASANPQNENWNDLDADGNWYPVEGTGNVWVPAGVGPGWDPYGAGYWAYYPTFGYTWVSSYPWGWLPYHCGAWGYYSFGWGWAPGGGCGRNWSPVIVVRAHPPGWSMPIHPLRPPIGIHPVPGQRMVAVDRGPDARGPWALNGPAPRPDHLQALNFNGRTITPVSRIDVRTQGFTVRGTAPGSRAVLTGAPPPMGQRMNTDPNTFRANPPRNAESPRPMQPTNVRPGVGYSQPPQQQTFNQRSTYVERPTPTTHYSAPPPQQPHYSAPPPQQPHYSGPPPQAPHMSSPGPHR